MTRWLGTTAIALFMLGVGCGDVGGEPTPDGSDSETGPVEAIPNDCSTQFPELFPLDTMEVGGVGWEWEGIDRASREDLDVVAAYRGVGSLDAQADLDCPDHMGGTGLVCQTNDALKLERTVDGQTETLRLALPVPLADLQLPSEGTQIRVVDEGVALRITEVQSSDFILHVGEVRDPESRPTDYEDKSFSQQAGPFQIVMNADYSDPGAATCVTYMSCPGIHRMEPLTVTGDTSATIAMGAKAEVSGSDSSFRVWNVYSQRHNNDHVSDPADLGGYGGWCTYGSVPTSRIVIARQSP
jgi:hypothetical protein